MILIDYSMQRRQNMRKCLVEDGSIKLGTQDQMFQMRDGLEQNDKGK